MSIRVFIVSLFFIAMPALVNGQSAAYDFYKSTLNVHYTERIVETEATVLAKEKQYLDDTLVQGDPTVLVTGDLRLTIDGHPSRYTFSLKARTQKSGWKVADSKSARS